MRKRQLIKLQDAAVGARTPVMYYLIISEIVNPNTNGYRNAGHSVHCIAK